MTRELAREMVVYPSKNVKILSLLMIRGKE
jgi:hypothetical protein